MAKRHSSKHKIVERNRSDARDTRTQSLAPRNPPGQRGLSCAGGSVDQDDFRNSAHSLQCLLEGVSRLKHEAVCASTPDDLETDRLSGLRESARDGQGRLSREIEQICVATD